MGHRLPIVLWLTAKQPQCGLDIDVITAWAVHRGRDGNGHWFREHYTLRLKGYHRTHSNPILMVIECFIGRLDLQINKLMLKITRN